MIFDKLENISLYKNIPVCVQGFLSDLVAQSDVKLGRYELTDDIYVNVESYDTKNISSGKFESHKKYIDIQLLLAGKEQIFITDVNSDLSVLVPYSEEKDIVFYSNNINSANSVVLDGTNFVMLFPHEAHAPQISVDETINNVIKVVAKIKI